MRADWEFAPDLPPKRRQAPPTRSQQPTTFPCLASVLWDKKQFPISISISLPHRLMFAGHYHRWLLARPHGIAVWHGECPVRLHNGRYFVVVGGLLEGRYAIFDTETSELVPCEVEACGERRC
jgi:hypothetical protein